jgi:hypothetical protein
VLLVKPNPNDEAPGVPKDRKISQRPKINDDEENDLDFDVF